jgi:hypothetical protein
MWFAFLLAACTYDNAVCHERYGYTPRAHVWMEARRTLHKVYPGQLAMCPSTGHRKVLKAHFELCVTVCPCHIICPPCVLLEGQAAAGSSQEQPVGLELADLASRGSKTQPQFDGQARLSASTAERIATLDSKP